MKIVFTLACSAAMLCNFAQGQDTAMAKIDKPESTIKKNTSSGSETPALHEVSPEKKSETTFKVPDYSKKRSILDTKVGPNGEDLFMKKNKYYYIDATGKKIKARRTDLIDKPKSS